jgi:hypothetical protein
MLDVMGRFLVGVVAAVVGLFIVGAIALWVLHVLIGAIGYLIVGALVVGGALYLYGKARRAVAPGTRTRNRLDAASATYRQRNR